MTLSAGSRLGPYEVSAPIGAGGMGEVYRARDSRLSRDVAVKVLPEHVAKDPEGRARFEREAQTVAGLNDPHVCSLFDVGVEGDVHYVVFELLDGETLRERLARGPLSPSKAVDLAVQMCQGLAAAHAKGIVHRDLKPENLFLTRTGLKILDFGLAKPQPGGEALSKEPTLEQLTGPGMAAGTVGYMSPEQVRGQPADARSDIFAAGVVLFEMLSGERPFRRETHPETLTAILREDPPQLMSPGGPVPPGLEQITRRCLGKDPADRFQSARDLAFALETVSGVSASVRPSSPIGARRVWAGAIVALVAAAIVAGLWMAWPSAPKPPLRIRPITSDPGREEEPALSPDGNQVAFVKAKDGERALYVKLIDGGEPLLLSQGDTHVPAWSPDGLKIAFVRHVEGENGKLVDGIFVIPALGGPARRLAILRGHPFHPFAWSPDQKALAISDRDSPDEPAGIFLLSLESGQRQRLTRPPASHSGDYVPRFSPDGRTLAFVRMEGPFATDVYVVPVDGGEERRLTEGNRATEGLDWTVDGRDVVFSSWRTGGVGVYSLWRVAVSGGSPEPLAFGEHGTSPTVSRTGRLAYLKAAPENDIWRVGGPSAPEGDRSPTRLISSTWGDVHPRYSPDGRRIAFVSQRSGASEIWICDSDGATPWQLTFLDDPMTLTPTWSPDGEQVAFISSVEGSWDVFVVSVSGGLPKRLTSGSRDVATSWSRDGRWIYFFSNRSGRNEVWKVAPEGGDPVQVTTQRGTTAFESQDGRFLYFSKRDLEEDRPGLWRIPTGGGEEVQVMDTQLSSDWALLERGILFVEESSSPPTLGLFDFSTEAVSPVAVLHVPPSAPGISPSPDGRWVLYAGREGETEADIMLVENFE